MGPYPVDSARLAPHRRRIRTAVLRSALVVLPLAGPLLSALDHGSPQDPVRPEAAQDATAPFPRAGDYVAGGVDVCKDCHEDKLDEIRAGHHGAVVGAGLLGCETCHGPGKAHAEHADNDPRLITKPPALRPALQTAVCIGCHRDQIAGHGGDPAGFLAAEKGCTACHTVHAPIEPAPHADVAFGRRIDSLGKAEPVDAERCITCHPLRDHLLQQSAHASLAAGAAEDGCETCHGRGSLHVETNGLGRLITRPDHAADGIETCRSCHAAVHPRDFHWHGVQAPMLSDGLTCTSCHQVHRPIDRTGSAASAHRIDRDTGAVQDPPPATNALCVTCHAPAFAQLEGTIHQALRQHELPLALGCGGCHPGGEAHARAGGRKDLVDALAGSTARHQRDVCMTCHGREPTLRHVALGDHYRNDVTCLECHTPVAHPRTIERDAAHAPLLGERRLQAAPGSKEQRATPLGKTRAEAERRCASCHPSVAAEFRQPNHHPVPEGHMACSDCHDPHGARSKIRDRELTERRCVECHKQYRGPFVFAHQASRLEGCTICHTPHGSSNRRMLREVNSQQNCLQCHGDFPAFHDQTMGSVFTNCLSCHTEIHGSNFSRFFFR